MTLPFPATRRNGFTLIEVMLAVAILVLLLGGVFGTVRGTVQATATLRDAQRVRDAVGGLFQLCQQTFPALPAAASLTWVNRGGGSDLPEIALRNAPAAFAVGARDVFFGETALSTRRQPNGATVLGIEYRRIDPQTNQVRPDPLWLPLIGDLQRVTWSFLDPQTAQWQKQWDDPNRHPALIRLSLVFLGDPQEWTRTFWLPKLLSPGNPAAPSALPAPPTPPTP